MTLDGKPDSSTPRYHVEHFPIGSCVCDATGYNCTVFKEKPGAKFTTPEKAQELCDLWNKESV